MGKGNPNPAPGPGGPLKISPLRMARFLQALAGGNYLTVAAKYAGVSTQTFRNWRSIGEQEIERYRLVVGTDPEDAIAAWLTGHPGGESYASEWSGFTAPGPENFDTKAWVCVLFAYLTEKADAEAEVNALTRVQLAARNPNHWQAAMTFLERRHPERWQRRDQLALSGANGGPVQVQAVPTTDALVARLAELSQQAGEQKALEQ